MWVLLILPELSFSQLSKDNTRRTRMCREPQLLHRCSNGRSHRLGVVERLAPVQA
jgi:hypothetical protein